MRISKADFIREQGFVTQEPTEALYPALMFQPRVIGAIVAYGVARQSPWVFLMLSIVLWWSAFVPTMNPFDAFYKRFILDAHRLRAFPVAPAPRRFAQGTGSRARDGDWGRAPVSRISRSVAARRALRCGVDQTDGRQVLFRNLPLFSVVVSRSRTRKHDRRGGSCENHRWLSLPTRHWDRLGLFMIGLARGPGGRATASGNSGECRPEPLTSPELVRESPDSHLCGW